MGIKIVTDSGCDIGLDYLKQNQDIVCITPCFITLEDNSFLDDFGEHTDMDGFFNAIKKGIIPKTAMVSPARFEDVYLNFIDEGHEIIYLGFSSQLSSVHQSSIMARENVLKQRPNGKIHIVDTLSAAGGIGIAMYIAVDMVREGKSAEEIVQYMEENCLKINHWFGVDDLMYLKAGGRISTATALIGTTLQLKPILTVDRGGHIVPAGKVRGRKKSITHLREKAIHLHDPSVSKYIFIQHSNCEDEALELMADVKSDFPNSDVRLVPMSMTITTHVGPGTLAIAFLGKEREI